MKALGCYSIGKRLSWQLAWQTVLGLGVLCAGIYAVTYMLLESEQHDQLADKVGYMQEVIRAGAHKGGEAEVLKKLEYYAPRRPGTYLVVERADGSTLFRDTTAPASTKSLTSYGSSTTRPAVCADRVAWFVASTIPSQDCSSGTFSFARATVAREAAGGGVAVTCCFPQAPARNANIASAHIPARFPRQANLITGTRLPRADPACERGGPRDRSR